MSESQPNNPLHGITLRAIVEDLSQRYGWEELAKRIKIRCFQHDPSVNSSLKFLRKTPWARREVEELYLRDQRLAARNRKRNQRRADMRAKRKADSSEAQADASGADESDP